MGNSSSGVAQHEQIRYRDHSHPSSKNWRDYENQHRQGRNRMRKSYLPPQSYMGKLVPPQKVLPSVSPVEAAQQLKPTFNGAILHNGGTISGRKINTSSQIIINHDKIRKKSSNEDTGISGISSPDLSLENFDESREYSPNMGRNYPRHLRNYESEPELIGSQTNNIFQQNMIENNLSTKEKRNIVNSKKQKAPSPPRKISSSGSKIFKKKSEIKLASEHGNSIMPSDNQMQSHSSRKLSSNDLNNGYHYGKEMTDGKKKMSDGNKNSKPVNISTNASGSKPKLSRHIDDMQNSSKEYKMSSMEKKCFYFGMENVSKPSNVETNSNRTNDCNKSGISKTKQKKDVFLDKSTNAGYNNTEKPYKRSQNADNHSIGFDHQEQDINSESCSLSSDATELDIPILLRPTLPVKRQQLPKFSPSAAWRSLDSPSNSSNELEENISSSPNFQHQLNMEESFSRRRKSGIPYQSGDSGISAGDASSPIGGTTIPNIIVPKGINPQGGNWTPQQDLEGSSSELEEEEHFDNLDYKTDAPNLPCVLTAPHTPPKLAARKAQLFPPTSLEESQKPYDPPFTSFQTESSASISYKQHYHKKYEPRGNDIPKNSTKIEVSAGKLQSTPTSLGSGTNWYLSRSEPNLLSVYDDRLLVNELKQRGEERGSRKARDIQEKSLTLGSEDSETEFFAPETEEHNQQSEIGYGPSSMNFNYKPSPKIDEPYMNDYLNHSSSNNNSLSLSHIMYLPSYVSRRISGKPNKLHQDNSRKTKSMDNFLMQETLFSPISDTDYREMDSSKTGNNKRVSKKKKFKYQSTIRVLERKKVERELAQEALEKEIERIQEIETMRRVEEEFMRKRMKEQNRLININNHTTNLDLNRSYSPQAVDLKLNIKSTPKTPISHINGVKAKASKKTSNITQISINSEERQEPEGAPSSSLEGRRYRNGALELTEELTEYRKPSRQYCDYNSKQSRKIVPNMNNFGKNDVFSSRHTSNSRPNTPSSNIKNSVIHPEIVCDIPNKPMPCTINVSRLTMGSNDFYRPGSALSMGSGPSSVISDNYRRDWVQSKSSNRPPSALNGRASSLVSLLSIDNNSKSIPTKYSIDDGQLEPFRVGNREERQSMGFSSFNNFDHEHSDETFVQNHKPLYNGNKMSRSGLQQFQPKPFAKYKNSVYRPISFEPSRSSK